MDVSIIFVNYKTKDFTINAIKSVIEKTQGIDFEIFVVDNNSQDGSIEAIEQNFPNINIKKNTTNKGFGAANNIAIKQAKGKYIFCLNTDTLLINNAIKIMFEFMEKIENQNVGVCGGYLYDSNSNPAAAGGHFPNIVDLLYKFKFLPKSLYLKYGMSLTSNYLEKIEKIDHIIGADIFFRKSVLDEIGLFDEKYFMYLEETDLCFRIKKAGYNVKFVKDAKIIHFEGKSSKNLNTKKLFKTSQFIFLKKNSPILVLPFKILYSILYLIDWIILKNNDSNELLKIIWEF